MGNKDLVEMLLKNKADFNIKDQNGLTPLAIGMNLYLT